MASKLYLVDISSFVFRAYYGIRPLHNSKGVPTHATYGVITMLQRLIRDKDPHSLVIIFDSQKPTFRKEVFDQYKANRQAPPEDLPVQFEQIKRFISLYPLPSMQADGFEADDLIATVVEKTKAQANPPEIVIVSADKDLMQLVDERVCLYDSMKEKIFTPQEVREKFGVDPAQVVDVLALAGDTSDNIPGVAGVGEKTAAKLISQWGSVENLLEHLPEIKGKLGENLKNEREMALLSKKLVTLHREVPLEINTDTWNVPSLPSPDLNGFYRELELKSLIKNEEGESVSSSGVSVIDRNAYELISTVDKLQEWVELLSKSPLISFDTETTGLDPWASHLVGLSFAVEGRACYIPVGHSYLGCPTQLSAKEVLEALKPLLENSKLPKVAQNAKFDWHVLEKVGIKLAGLTQDTLVASYLLNPEGLHNLDHLATQHLSHTTIHFEDIVPKGEDFSCVPIEEACRYAAEDADVAYRIAPLLNAQLVENKLWDCYQKIEIPLIEVLQSMESTGVMVDLKALEEMGKEFGLRLAKLQSEIFKLAGQEFNVSSPKQLADILFVKLALPPQRKTKTGYSTDVDVLAALSKVHPLPQFLLEHRQLSKLLSTYVEQLRRLCKSDGRIHTNYNQTVVATGRLSSTDPNLQNIPIRTEEGRRIRQAFIAAPGSLILSADYSQIELRLLALLSRDPSLIQAFQKGEDVHALTASKIFCPHGEEITPGIRSQAKTVNFGVLYGQSPFGLGQLLDVSSSRAKEIIEGFYNQFPSVAAFKEKVLSEARKTGEVRTWQGRRRLAPELNSQNQNLRQNAERLAFNAIFQGSAADLIKVAMLNIHKRLKALGLKSKMIMQVHDELVFEVPQVEVEKMKEMVCYEMENALSSDVPLKVSLGVGANWDEAH